MLFETDPTPVTAVTAHKLELAFLHADYVITSRLDSLHNKEYKRSFRTLKLNLVSSVKMLEGVALGFCETATHFVN